MVKPVILCVDDEKTVLNSLRQELEFGLGGNYVFELAESAEEGLEIIQELMGQGTDIHVVISDQLMPGMKGDQFLIEVNKLNSSIRKILLTGQANAESVGNAVNNAGLYRYIAKPWDEKDLRLTVEEAAKSYYLNKQLATQVKILGDLNQNAKVLSEEVHPQSLMEKFLQSALRDTGALRGLLQVFVKPGESYTLEGHRLGDGFKLEVPEVDAYKKKYPAAILDAARKEQKQVVLHNAVQIGDYMTVEAIQQRKIRSLYCNPIVKQDQVLGLLYLEQDQEIRFFSPEKVEFLNLLCAHGSICLDNALLYQNLEERVKERTRIIEEKNQQITDSIEYARRIQLSILPPLEQLKERFPESFVLYLPKDIVSGDFYWFAELDGQFYVSAVDCTGHGVPGAFMSVLGNNFLNQIVKEQKLRGTDQVLYKLHQSVRDALKQYDEQATVQDGMDVAFCRIDMASRRLQFSGARRPLNLYRGGKLTELKGGRYPAGGSIYAMNPNEELFSSEEFALEAGDMIYMGTDGFMDQFGGAEGRKFSQKRFQEMLERIHTLPVEEQREALRTAFENWRGARHQTDDVLVIGMRF